MAQMVKNWIFSGSGIGISTWQGNAGDNRAILVPSSIARSDIPWLGMMVRGRVQCVAAPEGSPQQPGEWRGPFESSQVMSDLIQGVYTYEFMDDDSLEFCAGAIDANGRPEWQPIGKVIHTETGIKTLSVGHVGILVKGVGNGEIAPHIFHAESEPLSVQLDADSVLVEVWRV